MNYKKLIVPPLSTLIISAGIFPSVIHANPTGAQIVHGQVNINSSIPGTMTITNSPNAIINWNDFSINKNELTRFVQQNSQSAVLNRVIGQNPSQILGSLSSNGQVFIINPNGIIFGANSSVNTQGLIASTLNLTDNDFLSGNYHFTASNEQSSILNEGIIRAGKDGNIILIAPDINNSGIIQSDGGQIVLAAGLELIVTSLDNPEIRFEVQAPENEVLNLGQILSQGGAIDLFADSITHSGEINANSLSKDEFGNIRIIAHADVSLTEASTTSATSQETSGGNITVESQSGTTLVSGQINASSDSTSGGKIHVLGEQVGIMGSAVIDSSGQLNGGEILIGGDYRGDNPDIKNAKATYIGQDVQIKSNSLSTGDGGKVIIWADDTNRMYGQLEAKGGSQSGNGGFIETSAHYLELGNHAPNVSASNGQAGSWLLDPLNITIASTANQNISEVGSGDPGPIKFSPTISSSSVLNVALLNTALDNGSNVTITTDAAGSDVGDISVDAEIKKSNDLGNTDGSSLTLIASRNININNNIKSTNGKLDINLVADDNTADTYEGKIYLNNNPTIDTNGGVIHAGTNASAGIAGSGIIEVKNNNKAIIKGTLFAKKINLLSAEIKLDGDTNLNYLTLTDPDDTGSTLDGSGNINVSNDFSLSGQATLKGSGSLTVKGSSNFDAVGTVNIDYDYNNSGKFNLNRGEVKLKGIGNHTGTFNIATLGTLQLEGTQKISAAENFYGTGNIFFKSDSNVTFSGNYTLDSNNTTVDFRAKAGPLTSNYIGTPSHGKISLSNGVYTYTPEVGFTGVDTFTYNYVDSAGNRIANGTANINVTKAATIAVATATKVVNTEIKTAVNETVNLSSATSSTSTIETQTFAGSDTSSAIAESTSSSDVTTSTDDSVEEEKDDQSADTIALLPDSSNDSPENSAIMQCQ